MSYPSTVPTGGFDFFEMQLGDRAVVFLQGEIAEATATDLRRRLLAMLSRRVANVTIDMEDVTAVDRPGLDALALVRRVAAVHSIDLTLAHVPLDLRDTLEAPVT